MKTFWDAIDDFCQFGESLRSEVEAQVATMKALADDMEAALAEGYRPGARRLEPQPDLGRRRRDLCGEAAQL